MDCHLVLALVPKGAGKRQLPMFQNGGSTQSDKCRAQILALFAFKPYDLRLMFNPDWLPGLEALWDWASLVHQCNGYVFVCPKRTTGS